MQKIVFAISDKEYMQSKDMRELVMILENVYKCEFTDFVDGNTIGEEFITISDYLKDAEIGLGQNYFGNAPIVVYELYNIDETLIKQAFARKYNRPMEILETERFNVRELSLDDIPALRGLYESLADCKFVEPLYDEEEELEFQRAYIDNMYKFYNYGLWLVFRKSDGRLVARIGIEHREIDKSTVQELGYLVGRDYQRQGVAYEVCSEIIKYAKGQLELEKLYTCIESENVASIAMAKKLGFSYYGSDKNMHIYERML